MDEPNITMEEYIQLMADKARGHGQTSHWETATNDEIADTTYPNPVDTTFQYGVSWGMDMAYRLPVQF
ncbi:hypothetical protein Tco_0939660 [Tanacetum coccineum]|uniref:Uncharacterized protein n=1 Tax=Tanacetum coccineum TaxID=301880 RepID=A0ABQ5DKT2_9ASTR